MDYNSKIYIAGHRGMVGSAVVRKLKESGYRNIVLRTRDELDLINWKKVNFFFESERPEYVILSAARVGGIGANIKFPADFLFENLEIQNNVIWNAHMINVKKLLFLGSSCAYPKNCPQPIKEDYLFKGMLEPTNEGYALAKIAGIKLCEKISEQYRENFISCMPTNIYGEGDNFNEESAHVIPALIRKMYTAKKNGERRVIVWGGGEVRREFLYVDDLASAIVWLMNNYRGREFLNIGTGSDISIRDLAFLIKNVVGFGGEIFFDESKPAGMKQKLLDTSRIRNAGWQHSVSLEDGLKKSYEYFLRSI